MNPQAQENSESNVVPESLLALAKDTRYVEECKMLLLQVLRSVLPERREDLLDRDAWYLSVVLYNFLVVLRKGRTLGMEICGLRYPGEIARWKVVAASLATASSTYALHRATADIEDSSGPGTESLRGTQRRQIYENQRQAMLRRANSTSDVVSSPMRNAGQEQVSSAPSSIRKRIRELIRKLLQSIVTAVSSSSRIEGPHAPVETQQRTLTAGIWLLRLHLAYYCLTGNYPSWTHRLVGHTVEEDGSKRLVSRPNNFRVVGILILAQATGTAIQTISQQLTHWWIDRSPSTLSPPTPSIKFEGYSSSTSSPSSDQSGTCAICQQIRKHPACPTVCGHVFCWKCLQQWVSSKGECPLCRTTCRPQDILALHSYTPPTE
jgi:peroxin-10